MPNYQNGKIYKIESYIGNCIYYGSTTQQLSYRMSGHRRVYKNGKGITSSKVLQYPDAKIYLVELYPCNSKIELHMREGYYIKNNDCVNKYIAGRTIKEWRNDNKEKIKKNKSQYYEDNKDIITKHNKQYRDDNKDKILKHNKQYYIKNKEKIKIQSSKQCICICGSIHRLVDKSRHMKTKKHISYMNNPFINFNL